MATKNDLLERYLQAVGEYLPMVSKADTLAELRANLLDQMEAREEGLGRALAQDDVAAILKAHGKPELVALRYLPQRSLIGPTIFPFYLFTTRRVLPLVVLVYLIAAGAGLLSVSRAALPGEIASDVFGLVPTLLIYWAVMTIVFAVIGEVHRQHGVPKNWLQWEPAKLPALKAANAAGIKPKSLTVRVIELCVHCLWMAYVLMVPRHPFLLIGPGTWYLRSLGVAFAPIWQLFYGLLIVLLVVQFGMKLMAVVNQFYPGRKALELATNLLAVVALGSIAFAKEYFVSTGVVAPSNVPRGYEALDSALTMQRIIAVNHAMGLAFRIALLCAVIGLLVEGWKLVKTRVPMGQLAF